jgi:CoA:oxalate CoA-transferase
MNQTTPPSPLAGLKVLDMSRVLAGPFAGRMLCDLGADVVKVEPPEGDVTRLWGSVVCNVSGYYAQQNSGKRNISIDLKQSTGVGLLKSLASKADILIENFRPGVMDRFGLDYTTLAALNPGLIMLSISGFGQTGPERERAAYAPVVHAEIGFLQRQSEIAHSYPVDLTISVADTNASLHGLVGILAALHLRHSTHKGQHIDLAMVDASIVTDDRLHYQIEPGVGSQPQPNEVWQTAAGPLMLAGDFRYLWRLVEKYYGATDANPEADLQTRIAGRRSWVTRFLNETCSTREQVLQALDRMNIAWGDVRKGPDVVNQPTVQHRGTLTEVTYPDGSVRRIPQSPYRFSAASSIVRGPAPGLGQHNTGVLKDWLGMEDKTIAGFASVLVAED